ncbi:polyketide synthase dehydratase domain-containing protein, partial [Streptomyces chisholmiae]
MLSGRLALASYPWLAEHRVGGLPLLPGTAFVDLAVRAGDEVNCGHLVELVLEAPLVLPSRGAVLIQVSVSGEDESGERRFSVHSSEENAPAGQPWVLHGTGVLAPSAVEEPAAELAAWPPPGAEPVELDGLYERLASAGVDYDTAFRGLRAVWRRDAELFAEVALPDREHSGVAGYGLHPALFDAALHALAVTGAEGEPAMMPFTWSGVDLHATGATELRVRLVRDGTSAVTLHAADVRGAAVVSVDTLALRPASAARRPAFDDSMFVVDWVSVAGVGVGSVVVVGDVSCGVEGVVRVGDVAG